MKFIHIADVHLGAEPESGSSLGKLRRIEIWEAFRDILKICEREQTDLLLIAGDLFHAQPLLRDIKEVEYLFRQLTHTKVVLVAGNHDCLMAGSHYYDVEFSPNVHFLMDSRGESVYFPEWNTEVFGLSYEMRQIPEARYDSISIADPSRINILLAHGTMQGGEDKSIPLHRGALEAAGFDYVALGHIHNRYEISENIVYAGSLEPLDRGETGQKGFIRGELTKQQGKVGLSLEFVPHAVREYMVLEQPVTVESTELSVCGELLEAMKKQGLQHMYLINLTGIHAGELIWNLENLLQVLRAEGANVVELCDRSVPDIPLERLRREQKDTLPGRFIERMEAVEDKELGRMALQYGLQSLLYRYERK